MKPTDEFFSSLKEIAADVGASQTETVFLRAILEVRSPGYVPMGVIERARMDAFRFTAEFPATELERIQQDAAVVTVHAGVPVKLESTRKHY